MHIYRGRIQNRECQKFLREKLFYSLLTLTVIPVLSAASWHSEENRQGPIKDKSCLKYDWLQKTGKTPWPSQNDLQNLLLCRMTSMLFLRLPVPATATLILISARWFIFHLSVMTEPTENQNISLHSLIHNSLKNLLIHKFQILIHLNDHDLFSCLHNKITIKAQIQAFHKNFFLWISAHIVWFVYYTPVNNKKFIFI